MKAVLGTLEFRKVGDFILRKDSSNGGIQVYTKKTLKLKEDLDKKLVNTTDKEFKKKEWTKFKEKEQEEFSKLQPNPISEDELSLIE